MTTAAVDLAALRTITGERLVLCVTSPESGAILEQQALPVAELGEHTYAERLAPLFADLLAGAPIRCDDSALRCVVSSESGAEIEYRFRRTESGPRLVEIRAPAYE